MTLFDEEGEKQIVEDYLSGNSSIKIGMKYGASDSTIRNILTKHGIKRRGKSEAYRKYALNENYFDTIDSPNKSYVLGFIFADGYVNEGKRTLSINQHIRDRDIIETIKKEIDTESPIKPYRDERYICLVIVNEKIKDDLVKLGCVQKKSFVVRYPNIDPSFNKDFIRGYFDGNAGYSIVVRKRKVKDVNSPQKGMWSNFMVYVVGSEYIINSFAEIMKAELNISPRVTDNVTSIENGIKRLSIYGNIQVISFLNWIYSSDGLRGERKYNQYLNMLEITKLKNNSGGKSHCNQFTK